MSGLSFQRAEFESRQQRAVEAAVAGGFDGLLVWGRGGGHVERHGPLMYFTDYYTSGTTIPDVEPHWSDVGFGAVLLLRDETVAFVDSAKVTADLVVATTIVVAHDLVRDVATALDERRLGGARLGLVGADTMTYRQSRRLRELAGALELVEADDIAGRLMMVKSEAEQQAMRAAAAVGAAAVSAAMAAAREGASEGDVAAESVPLLMRGGAALYGFLADTYGPDRRPRRDRVPTYGATDPLRPGEIFTVDLTGALGGYYFDIARTVVVDAAPTGEQAALIELTREIVEATVRELRPGNTIGQATRAGLAVQEATSLPVSPGYFAALGHGLGLGFDIPWLLPDDSTVIEPGMCIAIEKRLHCAPWGAAHERNVLVTEDGPVDLSTVDMPPNTLQET